jgi:hypothetical protein
VTSPLQSLFVCYIPGLDARRIDADVMPYLAALRAQHAAVPIRTFPNTELVPTLVSGVLPHQHRVWQVSLKPEFRGGASMASVADAIPDIVVTTAQCTRHFFNREYDLPAIPLRRRRRFELHRFKYTRRAVDAEGMDEFSGYPSLFGLLGDQAEYIFTKDFDSLPKLAQRLPTGQRALEFLEMYALDLTQHWHLDNREVMDEALSHTDRFVRDLHARCRHLGVRLMLLVDHGQEPVVGTVPLIQTLKRAGIPESEYSYFVELASARLWFHTERARRVLSEVLVSLPKTTVLSWQSMHQYDVCFEDDAFGELYIFADAGQVLFPHDFYQPIGNAVLGLMDHHQRQRVMNPVHRGNHGYLPHHASERGWVLMDESSVPTRPEARLIDIAPTILELVGAVRPPHMTGTPLFVSSQGADHP